MIKFNDLRVNDCDKTLIIDASVLSLAYYTNVYIDSIIIDTQDTYIRTGPSSNAIYTHTVAGNNKTARIELTTADLGDINMDNTLFFVYVVAKGTPAPNTPCGMDNINTIGTVSNLYPIYKTAITLLSEADNTSCSAINLINFIIKMNGLDLALKTCNYQTAIKYWNKFFKVDYFASITNNCGCGT